MAQKQGPARERQRKNFMRPRKSDTEYVHTYVLYMLKVCIASSLSCLVCLAVGRDSLRPRALLPEQTRIVVHVIISHRESAEVGKSAIGNLMRAGAGSLCLGAMPKLEEAVDPGFPFPGCRGLYLWSPQLARNTDFTPNPLDRSMACPLTRTRSWL
jgi:hypothetical protein